VGQGIRCAIELTSGLEIFMDGSFPVDRPVLSLPELEAKITKPAGHLNVTGYR
jgi:hypothetical protein